MMGKAVCGSAGGISCQNVLMDKKPPLFFEDDDPHGDEIPMTEAERREFAAAVAEGIAQFERGEFVSLAEVRKWVASWGSDDELPMPSSKPSS